MSSATSGSVGDTSANKNHAKATSGGKKGLNDTSDFAATTSVAAEAEQGDGPAAASAGASAVGKNTPSTNVVSVVVGPNYAAAACEIGVAVCGPKSASSASKVGVAAVGPDGAAATSNAANGSSVTSNTDDPKHAGAKEEPDSPK